MSSIPVDLFAPSSGFRPDARFTFLVEESGPVPADDPQSRAFADGYAKGAQDALARLQAEDSQRDAALAKIETAFGQLFEADRSRIEERLRESVLVLCEQELVPLAQDGDALSQRIKAAMNLLRRAEDQRNLRLHPEDIALLQGRLPDGLKVEADPSLERGELRMETEEGGVEDGPRQWRRAIADALGIEADSP